MATKTKTQRPTAIPAPANEDLDMQQIEIDIADAEYCESCTMPTHTENLAELEDLLEELVHTASKTQSSTVSRLCFLLSDYWSELDEVSKLADMAVCRKHGMTFEWSRRSECERVEYEVSERRKSKPKAIGRS